MGKTVAEIFRDLESANQAGSHTRRSFMLRNLHDWLNHDVLLAMEMVDE
jgi:hypothetical protein